MLALFRLSVIAFIVLTVIYVCLLLYSRQVQREKLEIDWDAGSKTGDRDQWIEHGLRNYEKSLRQKLLLGVYIVPVTLVIILIYFVNFY